MEKSSERDKNLKNIHRLINTVGPSGCNKLDRYNNDRQSNQIYLQVTGYQDYVANDLSGVV